VAFATCRYAFIDIAQKADRICIFLCEPDARKRGLLKLGPLNYMQPRSPSFVHLSKGRSRAFQLSVTPLFIRSKCKVKEALFGGRGICGQ